MIRVGVFYGGKSVEHEVSVISGIQAANAFDKAQYRVVPVYISREGAFYCGPEVADINAYRDIPGLIARSRRVLPLTEGGRHLLLAYGEKQPRFGFGHSRDKAVYDEIDLAFPVTHGTNVEDGALQGFFKTCGFPFVGSDVTASAVGMDKYIQKILFKAKGLPALDCRKLYAKDYFKDKDARAGELAAGLSFPLIVKPLNLGSSIGIKKAHDAESLREALDYAFGFANFVVVERAVENLREINCAVLGDDDEAIASECEEPLNTGEILSYQDKYVSSGKGKAPGKAGFGGLKSKGLKEGGGGMSGAKRIFPAPLAPELRDKIRSTALAAFNTLGCNGVARIDFLMDASSSEFWINEVNTIPGSLSFYLWQSEGLNYAALLDRLVKLALKRERDNAELSYSYETEILSNYRGGSLKSAHS